MGKKGGSTTVQAYKPTEQEIRLQKQAADYAEAVAPNALWLNNVAKGLLKDSLGTIQVDYNNLLQNSTNQTNSALQGIADLTQGILPSAYQQNMEDSIRSGVENTMGQTLNNLGARGILNSSVTNTAMNDISKNVSDTMAQQYQNNISTLNGLLGQQASLAGQNISLSAAAQEAAQQPSLNLWNASLGLNSGGTLGALNAVSGQGTTTSTTSGGGSNWLGGLFGGVANAMISCFVGETPISMADGTVKAIKDVKAGDSVKAYNIETGEETKETVIETMSPHESEVYMVSCIDEDGKVRKVITTTTQPLLGADGDFIDMAILRIGQELKNVGRINQISHNGVRKIYDLKVTGVNTYFANDFIAKGATNEW